MDGSGHKVFAVDVNWSSADGRWFVLNWRLGESGRWNAGNQVLCPGNAQSFSRLEGGSFVSSPFFQPPSIRPISLSSPESSRYFLLSISLLSQPICRKNLRRSILPLPAIRY